MAMPSNTGALKDLVRHKLNSKKVKLWLPPYTEDGKERGQYSQEFLAEYATELNVEITVLTEVLEELRLHALNKLSSKRKFKEEGVALLKVNLTGHVPQGIDEKSFQIEICIKDRGNVLKERIADKSGLGVDHLKVISCGAVIDDDKNLEEQRVTHESQVMVICLSHNEVEAKRKEDEHNKLQRTKEAAQLLAKRKDQSGKEREKYYLQIADQTGKLLDLPDEERESLTIALTLHEKGRSSLKKKCYGEAVLILLESDSAFKQCRSEILQAVDNYAILSLDIVWCYLCLENVEQLPDAEERLKICEKSFEKAHGPNMERLALIKGDSGKDLAMYVRLYLMQGILAYHQGKYQVANGYLTKAENLIKSLQVDDEKLMQLVSMGFDVSEARLGLRASQGNVSVAVSKITERKHQKKQQKEKEEAERKKKKMERKLGRSSNGEWVKVEVYEQLLSMGFPKKAVISALQQSNSDIHQSLSLLNDNPELLNIPDDVNDANNWDGVITDEMLAKVTELGFDVAIVREAIQRFAGKIEKAIEQLVQHGGTLPPLPSTSSGQRSEAKPKKEDSSDEETLTDEQQQAIAELQGDIPEHEEDYLDITLEEEAQFINEYKLLLSSVAL